MSERIGMVSLGCAKNQVNAEQMLFLLQEAGFQISGDPDGFFSEVATPKRHYSARATRVVAEMAFAMIAPLIR